MKFFSRQWLDGELTDEEWSAVVPAYERHLTSLLPQLPSSIQQLATSINLHDGLIEFAVFERVAATLQLGLVIGDLQQGYSLIHLNYAKVIVDVSLLRERVETVEAEVLYDEIDVSTDGRFEHRMIFCPHRELFIRFQALSWTQEPRADRQRLHGLPQLIEQ